MRHLLEDTHDLFELSVIKVLVGLSLPLREHEPGSVEYDLGHRFLGHPFYPTGNANSFFMSLPCLAELNALSLETINNNEMLPLLLSVSIKREAERRAVGLNNDLNTSVERLHMIMLQEQRRQEQAQE